jgi:hypothetical protein
VNHTLPLGGVKDKATASEGTVIEGLLVVRFTISLLIEYTRSPDHVGESPSQYRARRDGRGISLVFVDT